MQGMETLILLGKQAWQNTAARLFPSTLAVTYPLLHSRPKAAAIRRKLHSEPLIARQL